MALQTLPGGGIWVPHLFEGFSIENLMSLSDNVLLDADEEEAQFIGSVHIDGGVSKTFGTSGSKIGWLPGASITFESGSTVRVGIKKSTSIDTSNGPAARATIGTAAFDVYDDLVGGTDTITSTTWRDDAMSAGTPFTVADGDLVAVCFHLDTTSGTPSIKVRSVTAGAALLFPCVTLVTSGPTYTAQGLMPNLMITFDDGTLGWIEPSYVCSTADASSGNIGNSNIFANIIQFPFTCKIDAIAANVGLVSNAANFAIELYSTPLGTPAVVESIAHDGNITSASGSRFIMRRLTTPRTLAINTDYAIGVQQTAATGVVLLRHDVSTATYLKASGMGTECYAANSTAGGTFADANSGKSRYQIWARICALDDGVSAGGGGRGLIFGG